MYTNMTTATTTFIVGDFLEQRLEQLIEGGTGWDLGRSARLGVAGCLNGFIFHHWYDLLDRTMPGSAVRTVVKKIVADIVIGSNLGILGLFAVQAVLEKSSFQQFVDDYRAGWLPVYMSDIIMWPATQFVNFYFLPPRFRLLCVNLVTVFAAVIRSHISHNVHKTHQGNKEK